MKSSIPEGASSRIRNPRQSRYTSVHIPPSQTQQSRIPSSLRLISFMPQSLMGILWLDPLLCPQWQTARLGPGPLMTCMSPGIAHALRLHTRIKIIGPQTFHVSCVLPDTIYSAFAESLASPHVKPNYQHISEVGPYWRLNMTPAKSCPNRIT